MKKIVFILMIAISLAGGAAAVMSSPSYAQAYDYPPPPPRTPMSHHGWGLIRRGSITTVIGF
ncbi:MAG: hypothetical protein ACLPUX_15005 [Syntrophobacteraceae bacterium]